MTSILGKRERTDDFVDEERDSINQPKRAKWFNTGMSVLSGLYNSGKGLVNSLWSWLKTSETPTTTGTTSTMDTTSTTNTTYNHTNTIPRTSLTDEHFPITTKMTETVPTTTTTTTTPKPTAMPGFPTTRSSSTPFSMPFAKTTPNKHFDIVVGGGGGGRGEGIRNNTTTPTTNTTISPSIMRTKSSPIISPTSSSLSTAATTTIPATFSASTRTGLGLSEISVKANQRKPTTPSIELFDEEKNKPKQKKVIDLLSDDDDQPNIKTTTYQKPQLPRELLILSEEDSQLTREQEEHIKECLQTSPDTVLVDKFNIQITQSHLVRLEPCGWLSDEIINFYFELLKSSTSEDPNLPKCYSFNTFFYQLLLESGYPRVSSWTKKVDIFSFDIILCPIHLGVHWCLAVINIKNKRFEYYDSFGGKNTKCIKTLRQYVINEHKNKKNTQIDLSGWDEYQPESSVPQQNNGSDCGVFTCHFARCLSLQKPFNFSALDMPFIRKRMILEILCEKIFL